MYQVKSALVVKPLQLNHGAAQLVGNQPEAVALLHGVGGVVEVFGYIRRHSVLIKDIG